MAVAPGRAFKPRVHRGARQSDLRLADPEIRRALARELHDRVAQSITTILIDLENFKREELDRRDGVRSKVDSVQVSMREVLASLRDLLHELRGETDGAVHDLGDSLTSLVQDFERRTGIASTLTIQQGWPVATRPAVAMHLQRIAQEALANASRHGGAKRVAIKLRPVADDKACMTITDYGRGFDSEGTSPGLGMLGMKERAVLIGADLWIDAFPGYGTSVHVTMPRALVADVRGEG